VRAIDIEYLEMFAFGVAHPAGDICCLAIQRVGGWMTVRRQTRLAGGELIDRAKRNPAIVAGLSPLREGRKNIPHDRYTHDDTHDAIERHRGFQQHLTPGKSARYTHSKSP
jgi:hypothetical protein